MDERLEYVCVCGGGGIVCVGRGGGVLCVWGGGVLCVGGGGYLCECVWDSLARKSHFNQLCVVDQANISGGQFISLASCRIAISDIACSLSSLQR